MKTLILILLLSQTIQTTFAKQKPEIEDDWICKHIVTEQKGSAIYSCGVATVLGKNPAHAEYEAQNNAKWSFITVCDSSENCKRHKIDMEAKRSECIPKKSADGNIYAYTCYRLLVFRILQEKMNYNQELMYEIAAN